MMLDTVLRLLDEADTFAVVAHLNRQAEPLKIVESYGELVRHLYWQEKNLPAVVALARAGVQVGLAAAAAAPDPERAAQLKGLAKGLAYDLASFTWPGWAEAGIEIGPTDLALGLDAARLNVRLAQELKRGPIPMSRAYWMLGGHYLAAGELSRAVTCFREAETYAAAAREEGERLLAAGFGLLAQLLSAPEEADVRQALAQVKQQLGQVEHGDQFISQIETAAEVFGGA